MNLGMLHERRENLDMLQKFIKFLSGINADKAPDWGKFDSS